MAFPIIPFAAGVAVGSLVTYGYKDKDAQARLTRGAHDLYAWLGAGTSAVVRRIPFLRRTDEGPEYETNEEIVAIREGVEDSPEAAKSGSEHEAGGETSEPAK